MSTISPMQVPDMAYFKEQSLGWHSMLALDSHAEILPRSFSFSHLLAALRPKLEQV